MHSIIGLQVWVHMKKSHQVIEFVIYFKLAVQTLERVIGYDEIIDFQIMTSHCCVLRTARRGHHTELIRPHVCSADMGHESCGVLRFWSAAVCMKLKGQESEATVALEERGKSNKIDVIWIKFHSTTSSSD